MSNAPCADCRGTTPATEEIALSILRDLVSTPSVSGREADAVRAFLDAACALGFETEIDEAGNGIARRRAPGAPRCRIVLLGHIDTVPGDIAVRIEGGELYGRGTVDAKGPLAAMLAAAANTSLPDSACIEVIAAVGEETPSSPGAHHVLQTIERPEACIIGEPSGWDGVTLGYKGRLLVTARCTRDNAHSAGPEASAHDELSQWWNSVAELTSELSAGATGAFEQVQSTIQSWQTSDDGLATAAEIVTGFRLPTTVTPRGLEELIRHRSRPGIELRFEGHTACHRTDRNDAVVRALNGAIRAGGARPRPVLKTGTADLNVVGPVWRCPIAAYGPGDSALDHTPDERLSIEEFHRSIRVLERTLESLFDELPGPDHSARV